MCSNCTRLTRELREAREELEEWRNRGIVSEDGLPVKLRTKFRLRPQASNILAALMAKPDRVVSLETLVEAGDYHGDNWRALIGVNMVRIRHALNDAGIHGAITTAYGRGYMMSKDAADKVRAAV